MGKRRLTQRVKAIGEQIEASIRQNAEDSKLELVANDALFQVDRAGGHLSKKQKLAQKDPIIRSHKFDAEKASKHELEKVKKLQRKMQRNPPKAAAPKNDKNDSSMLWGADGTAIDDRQEQVKQLDEFVAPVVVKQVATMKRVASTRHHVKTVEVPAAGQSYNPEFSAHQGVLATAVANEEERVEKKRDQIKPLAQGLTAETLQFINNGDSDDDDDEDDDEDAIGDNDASTKSNKKEKVTKSQRNRRARHKILETQHKARRQEKSIIKQINTSKHILDAIVKEEKLAARKQEEKQQLLEQKLEEEPLVRVSGKMTKLDRSVPVALSDELTGSLRTLRPKGNALLERFDSMHKRNMIEVNHSRGRRQKKVKIIETK